MEIRSLVMLAVAALAAWAGWSAWRSYRVGRGWLDSTPNRSAGDDLAQSLDTAGGHQPQAGRERVSGMAAETEASILVRSWARGRQCAACGGPLETSESAGHHIALRDAKGMTREWIDIATERLPVVLAASVPMCWNCHIAETFRRQHPDLVTDRDDETVRIRH
jgi:hypothetical protein